MPTLAARVKECIADKREKLKVKDSAIIVLLAKHVGVKPPSIYDWINGDTKRLAGGNLNRAAEFFEVNIAWLDEGKGYKNRSPFAQPSLINIRASEPEQLNQYALTNDYVLIQALKNELGAGDCAVLSEFDEVDGQRAYRRDWLEKNGFQANALKVVTVKGDSMVPYVFNGNKVLINTQSRRIVDGEHYAIRVGSEPKIKRLFTQGDGRIRVESYNAPTDYLSEDDNAEVLGLVVDRNGTSWAGK